MGSFSKLKNSKNLKKIRVGGYGGVVFEIEKSLKKMKIYEWGVMWVEFYGTVRWGGTVGRYGGLVCGVVRSIKSLIACIFLKTFVKYAHGYQLE